MSEPTEVVTAPKPQSAFVTYADSPVGRVLVRQLVKHGIKVAGSTPHGTQGAAIIRADGGVPTYTDLKREGDIKSTLHMTKADVVIDLSGATVNQIPLTPIDVDPAVLDNVALLNACHAVGVKQLIAVSFAAAYGNSHHSVDESAELSRDNDLFRALARAESVLLKSDFNVVILRAGYIYGGHSPSMDNLAVALKATRPMTIGTGVVNFVYVDDVVSAIVAAMNAQTTPSRVYNIVDDKAASFDHFAETFCQSLGVGTPLYMPILSNLGVGVLQAALLKHSFQASNARAKAELHWSPSYPNQSAGLERMLLLWRAEEAPVTPTTSNKTDLVKA